MENTPHSSYTAVEDAFQCIMQTLTDTQDCIQNKWDDFKRKRSDLEQKMNEYNLSVNGHKRVSLCVGGTNFDTTEETLLKETDTFFWAMLRSGQWQPDDKDGRYFIDRSPERFSKVLEYLREGEVCNLSHFSVDETNKLREEFDFYQVPFPERNPSSIPRSTALVHWEPTTDSTIKIDDTNTIVSVTERVNKARFVSINCLSANGSFALRATRRSNFGDVVYFRGCGIALDDGQVTQDGGSTWENCFPRPQWVAGRCVFEVKFDFSLCDESAFVKVIWPTGHSKTLSSPIKSQLGLSIHSCTHSAHFELRQ